jgi:hypothetical protein
MVIPSFCSLMCRIPSTRSRERSTHRLVQRVAFGNNIATIVDGGESALAQFDTTDAFSSVINSPAATHRYFGLRIHHHYLPLVQWLFVQLIRGNGSPCDAAGPLASARLKPAGKSFRGSMGRSCLRSSRNKVSLLNEKVYADEMAWACHHLSFFRQG